MDSPDIEDEVLRKNKNKKVSLQQQISRSCFALAFSLLFFLLVSFSVLYLAVLIGNLSIWSPISLSSQCRIVSSSVDLRSSKVCELGLLNYKAKHVFHPLERKKYRCHYDYYWASVFKVEYVDHSGQARVAFAEAPTEALPSNCRPNFGTAWLTKDKLKVNETYECWYTLGITKVNINQKGLFDCLAEDPSTVEMLKRYYILFIRIVKTWNFSWISSLQWLRWELIAGLVTGFITSLLSISSVGILGSLVCLICRYCATWISARLPSTNFIKRAFFFVTYSCMSWIALRYVKRLGF